MDLLTVSLMQMVAERATGLFLWTTKMISVILFLLRFLLNLMPNDETRIYDQPQPGDTAYVIVDKPFLKEDVYEFTTHVLLLI